LQDKINAFWEITKKELEDRKAEMRNQDRQMEEMEDLHQRELKVLITAQHSSCRSASSASSQTTASSCGCVHLLAAEMQLSACWT
jgi:hypothetical protein